MKLTLNIVISRSQVFRNLLSSDSCQLIKDLSKEFKINILTPINLQDMVKREITVLQHEFLDIDCYPVPEIKNFSRIQNILLFVLKYITKSRANSYLLHQSKSDRNFSTYIKLFCSNYLSYVPFVKSMFRRLFYLSVISSRRTMSKFKSLPNCDLVFLTSLTDVHFETLVGLYYSSLKIKTIGTPRSWDNITSYGCFPWIPDKILSHSEYMSFNLKTVQGLSDKKIFLAVAPNYQSHFLPTDMPLHGKVRIGLACMGFTTNPDDLNILKWFSTEIAPKFIDKDFYVYQHPKFLHKIELELPKNVYLRVFPYESTTLQEYYREISTLSILFAGGTSALLDAAFCGTDTAFINFDCARQKYWRSALRYADELPHTSDFLDLNQIIFMNSKQDIETKIKSLDGKNTRVPCNNNLGYFIQSSQQRYSHYVIQVSRNIFK